MRLTLDYPPVWLAAGLGLAWAQAQVWPMPGLFGPGAALAGAGLVLMALAVWQFPRAGTTIVPHETPTALITAGVYRFSRNPIYLADALILAGACVLWGAFPALLLVPLFMAIITARFIRPEESRLRARFGAEFDAWAARVRRWI